MLYRPPQNIFLLRHFQTIDKYLLCYIINTKLICQTLSDQGTEIHGAWNSDTIHHSPVQASRIAGRSHRNGCTATVRFFIAQNKKQES